MSLVPSHSTVISFGASAAVSYQSVFTSSPAELYTRRKQGPDRDKCTFTRTSGTSVSGWKTFLDTKNPVPGVGVKDGVPVQVAVGDGVGVLVGVSDFVGVLVAVSDFVGVHVDVDVRVTVGVKEALGVRVGVGVFVRVQLDVKVRVNVGVRVRVTVRVFVGV